MPSEAETQEQAEKLLNDFALASYENEAAISKAYRKLSRQLHPDARASSRSLTKEQKHANFLRLDQIKADKIGVYRFNQHLLSTRGPQVQIANEPYQHTTKPEHIAKSEKNQKDIKKEQEKTTKAIDKLTKKVKDQGSSLGDSLRASADEFLDSAIKGAKLIRAVGGRVSESKTAKKLYNKLGGERIDQVYKSLPSASAVASALDSVAAQGIESTATAASAVASRAAQGVKITATAAATAASTVASTAYKGAKKAAKKIQSGATALYPLPNSKPTPRASLQKATQEDAQGIELGPMTKKQKPMRSGEEQSTQTTDRRSLQNGPR